MDYQKQHGFTLIELMVVIAIAAILLTVAIPGMNAFVAGNRQAGAVNDFLSTLYLARDEAMTRNLPVTICPSATGLACEAVGWEEGRLIFVDEDRDAILDAGEEVLETADALPAGMTVRSAQFAGFLTYRPNGRVMTNDPAANNGRFSFCAAGSEEQARIANIGFTGRPQAKRVTGDQARAECA